MDSNNLVSELVNDALSGGGDHLTAVVKLLVKGGITVTQFYLDHKAGKQFLEEIKVLFVSLTEQGFLTPLLPPSMAESRTAPIGWIMTPQGTDMFFSVYHDVARARDHFNLTSERLEALGVRRKLVVNLNSQSKGTDIRGRMGLTWPAQYREWMLKRVDPFQVLPTRPKKELGRNARSMVRKSMQSPAHRDLLLKRVLGLAQLCGHGEISLADLIELIAHACHYEKVARRYLAIVLGVHYSAFTSFALADCLGGEQPLGSLENPFENFAQLAPGFSESLEPIGVIQNGKAKITREKEFKNVHFKIERGTAIKENEQIYMISGWASALLRRPVNHPHLRTMAKELTVGLIRDVGLSLVPGLARSKIEGSIGRNIFRHDIHGNACYYSAELEWIFVIVKRTTGGQLVGKVSQFGDWRTPRFGGQGVFGMRCGCEKKDPKKVIRGSSLNGYSLGNVFRYRLDQKLIIGFDTTMYHWTGGDLPMILFWADGYVLSTYVQVAGECVYCATSRAMGTGCSLIIAGGW